jgi:hypothetical protein
MARTKKLTEEGEVKVKKGVTYADVKPSPGMNINRTEFLKFLEIYHLLRPYIERPAPITKEALLKKFPDRKKMVEDVWMCVYELKLVYPGEMIGRILND